MSDRPGCLRPLKRLIGLVGLILAGLVALQNSEPMTVELLNLSLRGPLIAWLLGSFAIGWLVGFLGGRLGRRRTRQRHRTGKQAASMPNGREKPTTQSAGEGSRRISPSGPRDG